MNGCGTKRIRRLDSELVILHARTEMKVLSFQIPQALTLYYYV